MPTPACIQYELDELIDYAASVPLEPDRHEHDFGAEQQRQLATLTGHDLARVKPYGKHLLIQMRRDDNVDTIARLTETGRNAYSSAFRSHSGRWEPLPGTGDLATTADLVVTLLATYFDPDN